MFAKRQKNYLDDFFCDAPRHNGHASLEFKHTVIPGDTFVDSTAKLFSNFPRVSTEYHGSLSTIWTKATFVISKFAALSQDFIC